MRRWIVSRYGGPERLSLVQDDEPLPGPGEVRVAVQAIGLNFADLMERQGVYPNTPAVPFTPGMELAGVVDEVGEGADAELTGRSVMAVPLFGSHAEKVCLPADRIMVIPEGLPFPEAAAFSVTYLTAQYALHELGRARAGERVVVSAAAGGVGTALLQLARLAKLEVLAVVGSEAKHGVVRELGAASVASYETCADEASRLWSGIDLVLDSVGGRIFRPLWNRLNPGGRYVLYGFATAASGTGISWWSALRGLVSMGVLVPFRMVGGNRTLAGFNLSLVPERIDLLRRNASELLGQWSAGTIQPLVGRTFPFEEMPEAHRHLQSRRSVGKVVVEVKQAACS